MNRIVIVSILLALGCASNAPRATDAPVQAADPAEPEPQTAEPDLDPGDSGLPLVELQRLNYALESVELLAQRWPWLSADETCIALTRMEAQFLLGCPAPEDSPYELTTGSFRGAPIFANSSGVAVLGPQQAPNAQFVQAVVGTVIVYTEANVDLTGFAKEKPWIFITGMDALIEGHPAFDDTTRTEEWLSIFVHEFFHTRQALQPKTQEAWGKIFTGEINPAHLIGMYMEHEDFKQAVDEEHAYLAEAVQRSLTPALAREALHNWLTMREARIAKFTDRHPTQSLERDEDVFLYVEGVARYVENTFMVDETLHAHESVVDDPRFTAFGSSLGKGYEGMWSTGIPQGKYYYPHGLHVGMLLDVADPAWSTRVHEDPTWLVGVAKSVASAQSDTAE